MAHTEQEDEEMFDLSLAIGTVCNGKDSTIVMGALLTVINDVVTGCRDKHVGAAFAAGAAAACNNIKARLAN